MIQRGGRLGAGQTAPVDTMPSRRGHGIPRCRCLLDQEEMACDPCRVSQDCIARDKVATVSNHTLDLFGYCLTWPFALTCNTQHFLLTRLVHCIFIVGEVMGT